MADKHWLINNVPEETRRKIKKYAKQHHLTIAGVLVKLTENIKL